MNDTRELKNTHAKVTIEMEGMDTIVLELDNFELSLKRHIVIHGWLASGDKLKAPWNPDQIKSLEGYQNCGYFHPFTCGICSSDLIPTKDGWICSLDDSDCYYVQDWCHDFMADGSWERESHRVKEYLK